MPNEGLHFRAGKVGLKFVRRQQNALHTPLRVQYWLRLIRREKFSTNNQIYSEQNVCGALSKKLAAILGKCTSMCAANAADVWYDVRQRDRQRGKYFSWGASLSANADG